VLTDFGRLLDFRAAAERHAASSRADSQAEQAARRHSSSAPLPVLQHQQSAPAAAAAAVVHSCASVLQAASTPPPDAAARPPSRPPSKASSSSSLRSSLTFPLRFFASSNRSGGADSSITAGSAASSSSASDAVVNRRRSFALETVLRQQQMRQGADGEADMEEPVSCFLTGRRGRIRASLSFSRRRCAGLGAADTSTGSPDGSVRGAGSSISAASSSGQLVAPGMGVSHSVPERRRSFGDFVVSRSRSFKAFTRNFACGSFAEEEQHHHQQQQQQEEEQEQEEEDVSGHNPGARAASEPALRCSLQHPQQRQQCRGLYAGTEELQQEAGSADLELLDLLDDAASEEGDSVSSFVAGDAELQAARVREHPLLTAEHKALMT
jgi:hypothetical protein